MCPLLLDEAEYVPDLIDLTKDEEARKYWLDCFEKTINTYEKQCIKSYPNNEVSVKKANDFKQSYLRKLSELKASPFAFGKLTVRSLLDLREHCMSQFEFFDVYSNEKRDENRLGLELLLDRCEFVESLETIDKKWHELFKGFLAGNVYDYGAQAFIQKQSKGHLDKFNQALNSIDDRFLSDENDLEIINRLKDSYYKCICVFVDNSGFDITLGVLPLVFFILKNSPETKVILCANSKPAINDITTIELMFLIKKLAVLMPEINEAYTSKRLIVIETGSASPCLDLSRINIDLAKLMETSQVDLVVLEGMGRSIHTNYNAKFKCDSLKAAVLKNQWLANRFGFSDFNSEEKKFPIVFKYEKCKKSS